MDHNHHTMDQTSMAPSTTMDHSHHDHDPDHPEMDHMGNHSGHMMKMYFHTGLGEYVLFEDLNVQTTGAMVGACFAVFAVAVLYEGLKYFREVLLQRNINEQQGGRYEVKETSRGTSQEQIVMQVQQGSSISNRMLSMPHLIQTLLHIIQVFVSYCLMLVFMTYNVWLCLAVVLGAGLGYFLFGWRRAVVVDANEHCH